jgi:hypothetical protein
MKSKYKNPEKTLTDCNCKTKIKYEPIPGYAGFLFIKQEGIPMKAQTFKWRTAVLFVALVSIFILASCINLAGGDGGSDGGPTITLVLPGNGESRTAYPNPGGLPSADVLAALHYQFDLTGPGNTKVSQSAQGVTAVNIKVPAGGTWDLVVEARLNGQQLYASGSMSVDVSAGGNTRVSVPLKKETGIGLHTVSGRITSEYGPLSGARVRLMQGGSGFYMEATTDSGGYYSITNVDEGSGNVLELPAGYVPAVSQPFPISGDLTKSLDILTVESVEEFGASAVVTGIIVDSPNSWNTACSTILNGGNYKNYAIKVTGAVTGISGVTASNFGNASGIFVSLGGGGSLTLGSEGALVNLATDQHFTLRNVSLIGMTSNDNPVIKISGGELVMRGGTISGNVCDSGAGVIIGSDSGSSFIMSGGTISGNTAGSSGGGVLVSSSCSFSMSGGTISGNTAGTGSGGGVFVNVGGNFTKNGGTIYGNGEGTNSNTASSNGHAVFNGATSQYRNTTHGPGDGTLSTGTTGPGSGWTP